ncbi:MAG: TauD/TfdA family dioxygenase [Cyanobacteria bacterium J06621_8]
MLGTTKPQNKFQKLHSKVEFVPGMSLEQFSYQVWSQLQTSKIVQTIGVDQNLSLHEFWDRASELIGDCMLLSEDPITGERVGNKWLEIRYDSSIQNAYRHSKNAQPLHTDGSYVGDSPYISFFFCIHQAQEGGATVFLDSDELIRLLQESDPQLLEDLCQTTVCFAKDKDFKRRPIIDFDQFGSNLNFNYYCVSPQETDFAKELVQRFHDFLQTKIVAADKTYPIKLQPGEALFFHDDRLIHGRKAFQPTRESERFFWKSALKLKPTFPLMEN